MHATLSKIQLGEMINLVVDQFIGLYPKTFGKEVTQQQERSQVGVV